MIALTRAWDADRVAEEVAAVHRVIISDPPSDAPFPDIRWNSDYLYLMLHDTVESAPERVLATESQISALIDFTHRWGGTRPLVVNCYAGRSRSPAALIIVLAAMHSGRERQIVDMVANGAPHALPNQHVIELGDRLLGCDGRLIAAVEAMPEPIRGYTGTAFFDPDMFGTPNNRTVTDPPAVASLGLLSPLDDPATPVR